MAAYAADMASTSCHVPSVNIIINTVNNAIKRGDVIRLFIKEPLIDMTTIGMMSSKLPTKPPKALEMTRYTHCLYEVSIPR